MEELCCSQLLINERRESLYSRESSDRCWAYGLLIERALKYDRSDDSVIKMWNNGAGIFKNRYRVNVIELEKTVSYLIFIQNYHNYIKRCIVLSFISPSNNNRMNFKCTVL